jgi:hypothetical protein
MFLSAISTHTRKFMHTSKLLKSCTPVSVLYVLYFHYSTGKYVFRKITSDNIIYVYCVVLCLFACMRAPAHVCWGGGAWLLVQEVVGSVYSNSQTLWNIV